MSELTKVLTVTCPSNFHWQLEFKSDSGKTYQLTYDWKHGGLSCSCPGYQYRAWCKHVRDRDLVSQRCGWADDAFANCIYDEKECPDCGEPTQAFYVGV